MKKLKLLTLIQRKHSMTYHSNENNKNAKNKEKRHLDFWTWCEIALYQFHSPIKVAFLITGLFLSKILLDWLIRSEVLSWANTLINALTGIFGIGKIYFAEYLLTLAVALVVLAFFTKPIDIKQAEKSIKELNIPDSTGNNTPIFIVNKHYKFRSKLRQMIFLGNGTIEDDFRKNDNLLRLGSKMGCYITGVESYGRRNNKLRITYRTVENTEVLEWKNEYLSDKDFELVVGEKLNDELLRINLDEAVHMLIAGSTGSGKSVLLALLLMQSLKKGAKVTIAELGKRGIDWVKWKKLDNCQVISNSKTFKDFFENTLFDEAERRGKLLGSYGCTNISEFNAKIDNGEITDQSKLNRWIVALDEAAQVYLPSRDKDQEEILKPIRSEMDKLVRTYRYCGIHLIIATQIPSSQVLTQDVRYLTNFRVCGVSTGELSKMTIGSEEAASIKQKGRFCTNYGDYFRGFLFRSDELPKYLS